MHVTVDPKTHERLRLVAAALGVTEGQAVAELLRRLVDAGPPGLDERGADRAVVPVHAVYQGERVEAEFDPRTTTVTVRTGALAGRTFRTPSRAAIEVVRSLNPTVSPNRNGWGFWVVTATGQVLQSLRGRH